MKHKFISLFLALAASAGTIFAQSGTCGDNLTWDLTNGVLTISGTGDMTDWSYDSKAPWYSYSYRKNITSVIIGNSVSSIGERAFQDCFCLTSVTIPTSVTSIGEYAFYNCSGLTSVTIPNSVKSIGETAFSDCSGLTSIIVENTNSVYDSRNNCNAIIERASNTLVAGCQNTNIPNSVTSIGKNAFGGCSSLTSITIPYSVTSIKYNAFIGCSGLTSVTIPNSVISIEAYAFYECFGMSSVTIGNSVTRIEECAFWGCSGLTSITNYAYTPQTIYRNVFTNVDKSIPLYVPAGSVAAYQAADVWKEFTNIQAIGDSAEITYATIADLYNMAADSTFTLGAFDVVYVASYQNGANMYIKDETGSMVIYKPNYGLQAGDHVEAGLQGRINIYHGLYEIAPISAKEELTVTAGEAPAPMEATEVPSETNVNQFVVFKNVSFTTDTAFVEGRRHMVMGTWNGQEITFFNQYYIGATLSANKTYNITAVNTIYGTTPQAYPLMVEEAVPESCLIASGSCGDNLTWTLSCDSVLMISGTGAMEENNTAYYYPWFNYSSKIAYISLSEGLTTISSYAFSLCEALTAITIPSTVISLGPWAFGDIKIVSVVWNAKNSNGYNFGPQVEEFVFGEEVETIPFGVCNGMSKLTSIEIPSSVKNIEKGAFDSCINITSVVWNAKRSSTCNFGSQVETIVFGEEVERIPANLCNGMSKLTSIEIPNSVTSIGKQAFYGCIGLTSITCKAVTPPTCGESTFGEIDKAIPLYVPTGSIEAYKSADVWKEFFNILPIEGTVEPSDSIYNIVYLDQAGLQLDAEAVTLHLPKAPEIEGFTFLKWQVVAGDLENGIYIQAVYTANEPTSAPAVYTNPANPAQKLIRNGNVYILTDDKTYTVTGQEVK